MNIIMKRCFVLLNIILTFAVLDAAKNMGPVGNIKINSLYECKDKPTSDNAVLSVELRSLDDKGNKALFANLTNKVPIDSTTDYALEVNKWESGGWKVFYAVKGKFCTDVEKLFGKMWQKVRSASKPSIPQSCPLKPGTYVVKNFQASSKDLNIPSIFYGKFTVKLTINTGKAIDICHQGEGDSQAP